MGTKGRRSRPKLIAALAALAGVGSGVGSGVPATHAATYTWDNGGGGGNWSTGANWSAAFPNNNTEPGVGDDAMFPTPIPGGAGAANITLSGLENARSLTLNDSYNFSGGTLLLGSTGDIAVNNSALVSFSGAIGNNNGLIKSGNGTLLATGVNSFMGDVNITGGTLGIIADSGLGNSANDVTIAGTTFQVTGAGGFSFGASRIFTLGPGGGTFAIGTTAAVTIPTAIGGTGPFTKAGTGALVLAGTNTYTGGTIVNAGTLSVASAGNIGGAGQTITLNGGTLAFGGNGSFNDTFTLSGGSIDVGANDPLITGTVNGTGGLTKSGSGLLEINGTASFSGGVVVNSGELRFSGTSSFLGNVVVNSGATLQATSDALLGNAANQIQLIDGTFANLTGSSARSYVVGGSTGGTVSIPASATFTGLVSGTGGFIKAGAGILTLAAGNTYGGATTISAGTLRLAANNSIPDTSAVTVASGATFDLSTRTDTIGSLAGDGRVTTGSATIGGNSASTTFNGAITLTNLTKLGTGQFTTTGVNTYSNVTINGGTFRQTAGSNTFNGALQLGSAAGTSVFELSGGTLAGAFERVGGAGSATFTQSGGTHTLSSVAFDGLAVGGSSGSFGVYNLSAGNLTVSGVGETIGGAGAGTFVQTGGTHTVGADLNIESSNGFVGTYTLSGGSLSAGSLLIAGDNTTTAGTASFNAGTVSLVNLQVGGAFLAGGAGVLNIAGAAVTATNETVIWNSSGTSLNLSAGSLTTPSVNTSGNPTRFNWTGGTLTLGSDDSSSTLDVAGSGNASLVKQGAGTLTITGNNTFTGPILLNAGAINVGNGGTTGALAGDITNPGTLTFNRSDNSTYSRTISGSGTVIKLGSGTLTLTSANTYSGTTFLSSGTIQVGNGVSAGSIAGPIANDGALIFNPPVISTYSGLISGSGSVTKAAAGSLLLSGSNLFTGPVSVTGGLLSAMPSGLGAGTSVVNVTGATLVIGTSDFTTNRALNLTSGTFIASPASSATFNGVITVSGNVVIRSDGALLIGDGPNDLTGGGVGSSITINNGPIHLTQPSNYIGQWNLAGTLRIDADNCLGDPANTVAMSGGTLRTVNAIASVRPIALNGVGTIDTNNTSSSFGVIEGLGGLTKTALGTLTVPHVRAGTLTVNQGTLAIAPDSTAAGVSSVDILSITPLGQLDLSDNKLIVTQPNSTGTWNGATYTGVSGLLRNGRNSNVTPFLWDGNGIMTSQFNATHSNLCSIGIARASDVRPSTASATALWAGQTIMGTDTLVMYTYGGDATLDGKINIDDYVKIDNGIAGNLKGWSNGDFNYDGVINIDDYTTIIDANIDNQSGVFYSAGGIEGVAAVPEPTVGTLIALASLPLLRRRRCRR